MYKLLVVFALIAIACADENIIRLVNSNPRSTWVAGYNAKFADMSAEERRALLGTRFTFLDLPEIASENGIGLPDNYNIKDKTPNCAAHVPRDQGRCGSCWAFGASQPLAQRYCAAGHNVVLSPQYIVSCDKSNMACNGGWLDKVWNFLKKTGTPVDSCMPYTSGSAGVVPACPTKCTDGSEIKHYKSADAYRVSSSESAIMNEIYNYGAAEVAFNVYGDFFNYRSGIYHHVSGSLQGGHAVTLTGWGVENGVKYWICQNSWGSSWGESGFFRIRRGSNECGIESMVTAGKPATAPRAENKCEYECSINHRGEWTCRMVCR
ncbi:hypothetical protein RCL1_001172 [Eukaryota sp. TZLM3-RCL]